MRHLKIYYLQSKNDRIKPLSKYKYFYECWFAYTKFYPWSDNETYEEFYDRQKKIIISTYKNLEEKLCSLKADEFVSDRLFGGEFDNIYFVFEVKGLPKGGVLFRINKDLICDDIEVRKKIISKTIESDIEKEIGYLSMFYDEAKEDYNDAIDTIKKAPTKFVGFETEWISLDKPYTFIKEKDFTFREYLRDRDNVVVIVKD